MRKSATQTKKTCPLHDGAQFPLSLGIMSLFQPLSTILTVLLLAGFMHHVSCAADETETVTGTIYCNNNISFYVNGELVAVDPVPIAPHNAFNVSFQVPAGRDVTFAVEAFDIADDATGLELNDRCLGRGGFRAFFSNGMVTNSSWKCLTWHYGPVNWKECFAGADRAPELKLAPGCFFNVAPDDGLDTGCFSRITPIPEGWAAPDFDDSRWEYATEFDDDYVIPSVWVAFPPGCTEPGKVISPSVDEKGENLTCPSNVDWGQSKFIWRPDIDLDNRILCRYTLSLESSASPPASALTTLFTLFTIATAYISM